MRERRKNLQGFARDTLLLFRRHKVERPHIVQTVGELNDDDTHVADHRQEHLPQIFCLLVFVRRVELANFQLADLRFALDDVSYGLTEPCFDLA